MDTNEIIVALTTKNLELERVLERTDMDLENAQKRTTALTGYLNDIGKAIGFPSHHYGNLAGIIGEQLRKATLGRES